MTAIQIDGKNVLASGSVVLRPEENRLTVQVGATLVDIEVRQDRSSLSPRADTKFHQDGRAQISLFNFSSALGTVMNGTMSTSEGVATYSVGVHSIGDSRPTKIVSFTFLQEFGV